MADSGCLGPDSSVGQDTQSQEVEACAAVHGSLDQFEAVHVSFHRAIAPFVLKGRLDGCFIPTQVSGEGCQRSVTRRFAPIGPGREIALLDDAEEFLSGIGGGRDLRATAIQLLQILSTGFTWLQDLPCGLPRRDAERQRGDWLLLNPGGSAVMMLSDPATDDAVHAGELSLPKFPPQLAGVVTTFFPALIEITTMLIDRRLGVAQGPTLRNDCVRSGAAQGHRSVA